MTNLSQHKHYQISTLMTWRLKKSKLPAPLPEDFVYNKGLYANLIKEAGRIQKYPEHILVMGRISTIWAEPGWWDTLIMGLKEALRLKSFDSKELEIRATRTPKGDPPYLNIVQENLYSIREPEAPVNLGDSAGQGGSGPTLAAQMADVAPIQAVVVVGGAKGKGSGSVGTKGSGSKFVIEDEGVHLSVGDEGERDEGVKGGGDDEDEDEADEEEHPQVSEEEEDGT
ncbi:hypothetical protein Hanom_Chr12g01151441 [Helianthus anomalus]